ncbi:MAG: hypothetical protein D6E12_10695 [Desulfovibrio sp.]|nr:MAG: hypothetical protein D6E12_10695 [Desulfovibrio sp.]
MSIRVSTLCACLLLAACLAAVCAVCTVQPAQAQNPFIGDSDDQAQEPAVPQLTGYPGFLQPLMEKINWMQVTLKHKLVTFSRDIHENPLGRSFWLFLGAAFLYGVLHALGPGHGKVYACSYFLSRPSTLFKGLVLGNMSMLFHVLSATIVVLTGYYLLKMAGAVAVEESGPILMTISYAILLIVGLYLFIRIILDLRSGKIAAMADSMTCGPHSHDFPPSASDSSVDPNAPDASPPEPAANPDKKHDLADTRSMWATAMAVGVVPCPGASIILIFALSQKLFVAGLLAMLAISLGMGATITLVACSAILFHKTMLAIAGKRRKLFVIIHALLSLTGALAILGLGGLLLLGQVL